MAHKSKEVLNSLAKIASAAYLGKSKTPLNTSLKKIAQQEGLNPHQVEYVAAEANRDVWAQLFSLDKKASYDFPLADAKSVLEGLQVKPEEKIVKTASLDYLGAPDRITHEKLAYGTFEDQATDKTASERRYTKKELQNRMEKMAMAKEELERQIITNRSEQELLELSFVKQARELVMQEAFVERGAAVEKIAEFVRSAADKDTELGKNLMHKLSHVLKKQGLVKEADLKAPEEYISKNLPAKIVNGRHALYITIETLRQKRNELEPAIRAHEIVDSSLPFVREKLRAL
jgi:hypothetical protein